jgi:UDP-N-acetylmuramate dehydrogenase
MEYDLNQLASQLAEIADCQVRRDQPLAPFTSYNIGGPAALWVAPATEETVGQALQIIHASAAPLFILGRGSNVLISDKGWQGATLVMGENLNGWTLDGTHTNVLAGTLLTDLIHLAVSNGLSGMELMAGIPGSVGGALRMNAGAFGQEIESTAVSVKGFLIDGSPFEVDRSEIDFAYRRVPFLEEKIITSGRFKFNKENVPVLKERMQDILALRAKKQPLAYPSCGSVFKRPPGYYAGVLIEEAGLKGEKIGGAAVSEKHSGFILNVDNATAADVYALMRRVESRVFERFGVTLEREVKLIGEFDD